MTIHDENAGGRRFVTLEEVAACYQVEVAWVEQVYESGLLGEGRRTERSIAISHTQLDRVAEVVRLHLHYGLELDVVAMLLSR